jgi:hypothetical protein
MGRPPHRRRSHRRPKPRVLIACEGNQTEPNYFDGLRREQAVQNRFVVKIVRGDGKTPLEAVEKALAAVEAAEQRGPAFRFDEVWCVLDVEQAGENPQLDEARKLAGENHFRVALSNPAFEVWILSHFERTAAAFIDCDKVIEQLNKHWLREYGREYEKADRDLYRRLRDRTTGAVENARWVREQHFAGENDAIRCNSSTEVYRLAERLLGALPQD